MLQNCEVGWRTHFRGVVSVRCSATKKYILCLSRNDMRRLSETWAILKLNVLDHRYTYKNLDVYISFRNVRQKPSTRAKHKMLPRVSGSHFASPLQDLWDLIMAFGSISQQNKCIVTVLAFTIKHICCRILSKREMLAALLLKAENLLTMNLSFLFSGKHIPWRTEETIEIKRTNFNQWIGRKNYKDKNVEIITLFSKMVAYWIINSKRQTSLSR